MTTKEIAEFFNVSERTIQRKAKTLGIIKKQNNSKDWTKEECDLLSITFKNDKSTVGMTNYITKEDLKDFTKEIVKDCLSEMFKQIIPLIQNNQPKQIEVQQDYYSILGYMILKGIDEAKFSEMICYGKEARKISESMNKPIRKIPDERFGQVNSYHIEVLKRLFEI